MLNRVSIYNFKCLRDVQIELERFTIFVGPNASGKSSILQALNFLCCSFRSQVESALSQGLSRGSKDFVEVAAESDGKGYRYRTRQLFTLGDLIPPNQWSGQGCGFASNINSSEWKLWPPDQGNQSSLPISALLQLETSKLIQPNPISSDPTVMAPDGSGLHSVLANMALNDPDSWQQLQTNLRRIIPTIRRLRHTKSVNNQPPALLFDTIGGDSLLAYQVSEGTLLVLGLLAALHASDRPSLVLLDDLDRGLHPKAQRELISFLRGLLETNPDLQMLATTHSPYLLDCMEPNEVRMTYLSDDGSTICAPLTQHPKFQKWKDEMHSGELWSLFGEKWVAEQGVPS